MSSSGRSVWSPPAVVPAASVRRLLSSGAFRRSRASAVETVIDAERLRRLVHEVSAKEFADASFADVRLDVGPAVALVHALADDLDAGLDPEADGPARCAHQRLVVAALHYLVLEQDVIPDDRVGGALDDVAILHWVCAAAHQELEPYLHEFDAH